jgi:DNA-directed RNA polymerase specialized sigma24 family protein
MAALTPPERLVLLLAELGIREPADLAVEMCVSINAVNGYIDSALQKLNAQSLEEAVLIDRKSRHTPSSVY